MAPLFDCPTWQGCPLGDTPPRDPLEEYCVAIWKWADLMRMAMTAEGVGLDELVEIPLVDRRRAFQQAFQGYVARIRTALTDADRLTPDPDALGPRRGLLWARVRADLEAVLAAADRAFEEAPHEV